MNDHRGAPEHRACGRRLVRRAGVSRLLRAALGVLATGAAACSKSPPPAEPAPPIAAPALAGAAADPARTADPVAFVSRHLPQRRGFCAQVKSVADRNEAEQLEKQIEDAAGLPVALIAADLGPRGTWWRLCVGDEAAENSLVTLASQWTAADGKLARWLDPPTDNAPRFFVLSQQTAQEAAPSEAAARAVSAVAWAADAGEPASPAGPLWFGPARAGERLLAVTAPVEGEPARFDVLAVNAAGERVHIADAAAPGCAACAVALADGAPRSRRVIGAWDVLSGGGDELVVEETSSGGTSGRPVRFVSVLGASPAGLERRAGVLLASERPSVVVTGAVQAVQADSDPAVELVLKTTELRIQPGRVCALDDHVDLFDEPAPAAENPDAGTPASSRGLARIDVLAHAADDAAFGDGLASAVTALDAAGVFDPGSRVCAAFLGNRPSPPLAQLCSHRIRRLLADGALIDAANAAALLMNASPALRAPLAGPLYDAAHLLDADPRLTASEQDCATAPLATIEPGVSATALEKRARARLAERKALGDLDDAVFIVALRDGGQKTPTGTIAAKWLARLEATLPARYAAIRAKLGNPATADAPPSPTDPGFGGAP